MDLYANDDEAMSREEAIRKQIKALQAELEDVQAEKHQGTPKKGKDLGSIIVQGTPSPTKKRKLAQLPSHTSQSQSQISKKPRKSLSPPKKGPLKPSTFLDNLSHVKLGDVMQDLEDNGRKRAVGFGERSIETGNAAKAEKRVGKGITLSTVTGRKESISSASAYSTVLSTSARRDDRLALIEELLPCSPDMAPKPPADDPHFQKLEPYSGIHLSKRLLPHDTLSSHLLGRYYFSPSLLYSVIRPLPSNQGYDIPVEGDWVTIAIIAQRGEIKFTNAGQIANNDEDEDASDKKKPCQKDKGNEKDASEKRAKRYMSIKLVDLGSKVRGAGDALLTMLLFEADEISTERCEEEEGGGEGRRRAKVYKGGSGGAFEACMKLHEGAVIALLNPRILKPYQRNTGQSAPHPTNNILAVTPTSAQSIAIIGQSRDLGMCGAARRDGKVCGAWCDKRISEVCEFHVERAVGRKRAGRAEFSIGTSGISSSAKKNFDPDRKRGLLPGDGTTQAAGGSTSTYVIPGHVVSAGGRSGPEYVGEKIGRGREERVKRKREEKTTEAMLNKMLGSSGGSTAAGTVQKARAVMKELKAGKTAGKAVQAVCESGVAVRSGYSAEAIKKIGFDPGRRRGGVEVDTKRKLEVLASLEKPKKEIILGPRPGARFRSGVVLEKRGDEGRNESRARNEVQDGADDAGSDLEIVF